MNTSEEDVDSVYIDLITHFSQKVSYWVDVYVPKLRLEPKTSAQIYGRRIEAAEELFLTALRESVIVTLP